MKSTIFRKKIRLGEYNVATEEDCVIDTGFSDCADPAVDFLPEEIIPFPDFDPDSKDLHHDIALIRLQGKAVYSGNFIHYLLRKANTKYVR